MRKNGLTHLLAALLVSATAICAQPQPARPVFDAFEVAVIKPTAPNESSRYIKMQGTREFVVKDYSVKLLIAAAYNLTPQAISGGPAWTDSEHYDIVAGTPGEVRPNLDEQMAMVRQLLADRFKLAFHREQKELSVYELTVAKDGPKLKESTTPADEQPVLINVLYPDHVLLPARNATMAQFASMMQKAVLDRPVLDKTELHGRYDFDLEWTPDETQFGGQGPPETPEATKPHLFTAVQQELGLRIRPAKGPVQTIAIDRVERPSEN